MSSDSMVYGGSRGRLRQATMQLNGVVPQDIEAFELGSPELEDFKAALRRAEQLIVAHCAALDAAEREPEFCP